MNTAILSVCHHAVPAEAGEGVAGNAAATVLHRLKAVRGARCSVADGAVDG